MRHTKLCVQRVLAAHSPEVKQMGHETDHSLPSSAKVHNSCSYTSTFIHSIYSIWKTFLILHHAREIRTVKNQLHLAQTMFLYENTVSVTENILIFYALKLSAH
jgi:hypothetical protein